MHTVIRFIKIVIAIVAIVYIVMLLDIMPLLVEVSNTMNGNSPKDKTDELSCYDTSAIYAGKAKWNSTLIPLLWMHTFRHGFIYVIYSYEGHAETGELVGGAWHIFSKWEIEKVKGIWVIADRVEAA